MRATAEMYHEPLPLDTALLVVGLITALRMGLIRTWPHQAWWLTIALGVVLLGLSLRLSRRSLRALGVANLAWPLVPLGALLGALTWWPLTWLQHTLLPSTASAAPLAMRGLAWPQLLAMVGLGAIFEEVVWRGVLLRALCTRLSVIIAVPISACAFAIAHGNWAQLGPTLLLGLVWGTLTVRTQRLGPAIAWHVSHNATAVLVAFAAPRWLAHPGVAGLTGLAAAGLAIASRRWWQPPNAS